MSKQIFKRKILDSIFGYATGRPNCKAGDHLLASFQHDVVCDQFAPYRYDSATINAVQVDDHFLITELSSFCFQVDHRLAIEYENVSTDDPFSPLSLANPGRIVSADFDRHLGEAKQSNPYYLHAQNFSIGDGFMLSFLRPGHSKHLLGMEYHQAIDNLTGVVVDVHALEQVTFPFALAWMCRNRMIDEATLHRYFVLLSNLSALELQRLRMYVNSPTMNLKGQADTLGIGVRRYKDSLYRTRDKVSSRLTVASRDNFKSLRPVLHDYSFLKMMGNPAQNMLIPGR